MALRYVSVIILLVSVDSECKCKLILFQRRQQLVLLLSFGCKNSEVTFRIIDRFHQSPKVLNLLLIQIFDREDYVQPLLLLERLQNVDWNLQAPQTNDVVFGNRRQMFVEADDKDIIPDFNEFQSVVLRQHAEEFWVCPDVLLDGDEAGFLVAVESSQESHDLRSFR